MLHNCDVDNIVIDILIFGLLSLYFNDYILLTLHFSTLHIYYMTLQNFTISYFSHSYRLCNILVIATYASIRLLMPDCI